jgi:D-alanyl-lipoteichoic acid acyltransferase DltB (MBOAT superfamily)
MSFTDLPFLVLLATVYLLWLCCRAHYRLCCAMLLTSSLIFYGYHQKWLLALLLVYCAVNWAVGCWLTRGSWPRVALAIGVAFNLLVLSYWKYTPLILRTLAGFDLDVAVPANDWAIPFGISFYAFTGIAYMVDVYRKVTPAEMSFWRYTLSAVFFPHLVAGPILRPDDFLTKLKPETLPARTEEPFEALMLLARGYFKKAVLADRIAIAIDPFFAHVAGAGTEGVWALPYVYLYAFQIYFDFSGYTDIARGLGLLFGYRWPDNFNLPYLAASVQDFWRRWHITLSLFLKDYLYVPLGGSRHGWWRTNLNLMVTMLLGGLWHGASWSFLLWGGIHGAMLVGHRCWQWLSRAVSGGVVSGAKDPQPATTHHSSLMTHQAPLTIRHSLLTWMWHAFCVLLTFHGVCLAWCFFRLTVLSQSLTCVAKWFVFDPDKMFVGAAADPSLWLLLIGYGILVGTVAAWKALVARPQTDWSPLTRGVAWGGCAALLVLAAVLSPGGEKPPFIYFQF